MSKKQDILKTAATLFARQGFDAATTQQIAAEAGVTESLIYYHFSGKEEIFTTILRRGFEVYLSRLETAGAAAGSAFETLERIVDMHLAIVDEMPAEAFLIIDTCPSRLNDPGDLCTKQILEARHRLTDLLTRCLGEGMASGEFVQLPVPETVGLFLAGLNGLIRQRALGLESFENMNGAVKDFCRRSLLKQPATGGTLRPLKEAS
jgi:AcrR family transcriptional regulator